MAKFNHAAKDKEVTSNYMGGKSFKQPEKEELVFAVITSFIESSYYEKKGGRIDRIKDLVAKVAVIDPLFVAKLAIITRREFHMRSSSQVTLAELARNHRGDSLVQRTILELAERPDDLVEIAAYLGAKMPNGVKRGIAKALHKFDSYQLSKYRAEGKEWSLVDLFNLVHPKPANKEQSEIWAKLLKGELKSDKTWESRLSAGENKGEVFSDMLRKNQLGYMATLRNLRNIVESGNTEAISAAAKLIADPEKVKRSKQLPFRYISAFEALKPGEINSGLTFEKQDIGIPGLRSALVAALTASCQNIPLLHGKTVILSDNSGSMTGDRGGSSAISAHSRRTTSDIANLFAAMYWLRANNTYVGVFGDELIQPKLDREKDLFDNYTAIHEAGGRVGPGTEAGVFQAFHELINHKQIVDRIVIFSDSQVGEGCNWYGRGVGEKGSDLNALLEKYRKINPKVMVYSIDLKGYGNKMFKNNTVLLAGWSDKLFELMSVIEKKEGLVQWIQNYPVLEVQQ